MNNLNPPTRVPIPHEEREVQILLRKIADMKLTTKQREAAAPPKVAPAYH
jgi:hypothetical protein